MLAGAHQAIATNRRFPVGAEVVADGVVHFRSGHQPHGAWKLSSLKEAALES